MTTEVLAITDCQATARRISAVFDFISYKVTHMESTDKTLNSIKKSGYLLAFLSLSDTKNAQQVTKLINKAVPDLPVYNLCAEGTETTQTLIKGTEGNMPFPFQYEHILNIIQEIKLKQKQKSEDLKTKSKTTLTGSSVQIREIESLIAHVSPTDANVLLLGESGTGKEVVARSLHQKSSRSGGNFVAVNCAAIPPELLESELFGHEKGSFSGAISMRRGRFELADGGTLFLDEIGDLPLPMQVKLLRIIQERTFERVGGTKTIISNVRLISATHQDLEQRIDKGEFRLDLYYRLNVFPIDLAPLRERTEDIPYLIEEFARKMTTEANSSIKFADCALKALIKHPLPGNVRELENLVERMSILYPGATITCKKLPQRYQGQTIPLDADGKPSTESGNYLPPLPLPSEQGINLKDYLSTMEKTLIEQALENSDWVVAKAAKSLALQRTTLVEKIRKLEIQNTL